MWQYQQNPYLESCYKWTTLHVNHINVKVQSCKNMTEICLASNNVLIDAFNNDDAFPDVVIYFVTTDISVKVHRSILRTIPYFRTKINQEVIHTAEERDVEFILFDLVKSLYTGHITLAKNSFQTFSEYIQVAKEFEFSEQGRLLKKYLYENMSEENMLDCLDYVFENSDTESFLYVKNFISKNPLKVMKKLKDTCSYDFFSKTIGLVTNVSDNYETIDLVLRTIHDWITIDRAQREKYTLSLVEIINGRKHNTSVHQFSPDSKKFEEIEQNQFEQVHLAKLDMENPEKDLSVSLETEPINGTDAQEQSAIHYQIDQQVDVTSDYILRGDANDEKVIIFSEQIKDNAEKSEGNLSEVKVTVFQKEDGMQESTELDNSLISTAIEEKKKAELTNTVELVSEMQQGENDEEVKPKEYGHIEISEQLHDAYSMNSTETCFNNEEKREQAEMTDIVSHINETLKLPELDVDNRSIVETKNSIVDNLTKIKNTERDFVDKVIPNEESNVVEACPEHIRVSFKIDDQELVRVFVSLHENSPLEQESQLLIQQQVIPPPPPPPQMGSNKKKWQVKQETIPNQQTTPPQTQSVSHDNSLQRQGSALNQKELLKEFATKLNDRNQGKKVQKIQEQKKKEMLSEMRRKQLLAASERLSKQITENETEQTSLEKNNSMILTRKASFKQSETPTVAVGPDLKYFVQQLEEDSLYFVHFYMNRNLLLTYEPTDSTIKLEERLMSTATQLWKLDSKGYFISKKDPNMVLQIRNGQVGVGPKLDPNRVMDSEDIINQNFNVVFAVTEGKPKFINLSSNSKMILGSSQKNPQKLALHVMNVNMGKLNRWVFRKEYETMEEGIAEEQLTTENANTVLDAVVATDVGKDDTTKDIIVDNIITMDEDYVIVEKMKLVQLIIITFDVREDYIRVKFDEHNDIKNEKPMSSLSWPTASHSLVSVLLKDSGDDRVSVVLNAF